MGKLTRHRKMSRYGPIDTGLFKVHFYGPVLPDTPDGMPCWYQASHLVANAKEGKASFEQFVEGVREHMACAR